MILRLHPSVLQYADALVEHYGGRGKALLTSVAARLEERFADAAPDGRRVLVLPWARRTPDALAQCRALVKNVLDATVLA
jgi:hypothetical protein